MLDQFERKVISGVNRDTVLRANEPAILCSYVCRGLRLLTVETANTRALARRSGTIEIPPRSGSAPAGDKHANIGLSKLNEIRHYREPPLIPGPFAHCDEQGDAGGCSDTRQRTPSKMLAQVGVEPCRDERMTI